MTSSKAPTRSSKAHLKAVEDLTSALMSLDDNLLACRDIRHAWSVESDYHVTKVTKTRIEEIVRVLVCMRCEAVRRHETYHPSRYGLEKIRQRYDYDTEKGYLMRGVPTGVKPSDIVQAEQYRRVLERLSTLGVAEQQSV